MIANINNLTQSLCDLYLRCPVCHKDGSLKLTSNTIICIHCNCEYKMKYGIPALMPENELGIHCQRFLDIELSEKGVNPFKRKTKRFYHYIVGEREC